MPDLTNSQRRLYKATYAPTRVERPARTTRGAAKAAFIAGLSLRPSEFKSLKRKLSGRGADPQMVEAIGAIEPLVMDTSPASAQRYAQALAPIDAEVLVRFAEEVAKRREETARRVAALVTQVRTGYQAHLAQPSAPASAGTAEPAPVEAPEGVQPRTVESRDPQDRLLRVTRYTIPAAENSGGTLVVQGAVQRTPASGAPAAAAPAGTGTLEDALAWASTGLPAAYRELHGLAQAHAPVPFAYSNAEARRAVGGVVPRVAAAAERTRAGIEAFRSHMKVEPIGRLHLERLQMTPVGIQRGELVSSIPLTPKETVNITHREWSVTTEEFDSIVQDYFEGYSEHGVAEKNDVAQSTENQVRHSSALSFGASASASYLGVTVSSSLGYNASSSDEQARKDSRNHSISSTRQASARTRKDHKTTFRVSSVVGSEDTSVRVITNPSDTSSMRVDYYRMMRKWKVDLYRYGLRMTYDIVIPSPGADLLQKIEEMAALDAQIDTPFDFTLTPGEITRENWQSRAAEYQASVEAPPRETQDFMASANVQTQEGEKDKFFVGAVEFDVDTDYEVDSGKVIVAWIYHDIGDEDFDLLMDVQFDAASAVTNTLFDNYPSTALTWGVLGRSGHLSVGYFHRGVATAKITVNYKVRLRDDVYKAWQFRAWSAIRQGAEQQYQQSRQQLKDRRAALATEIAPFDALTLRRMELEEIEKGVLRWLFGPSFNVSPAGIQAILSKMALNDPLGNDALDPSSLTQQQWKRMLEFGEFIKYVQQAIEWENVIYFMYPYFWDTPDNWTLKQFLQHPDALHRTFLRAGSARVVLTIRPGFEDSFAQLIETGAFGKLPGDHPYVTIAEEIQNYAKTNYPGIPPASDTDPADEDEVTRAEQGVLQATWWEYTPTSALDVQVNTSLPEMA